MWRLEFSLHVSSVALTLLFKYHNSQSHETSSNANNIMKDVSYLLCGALLEFGEEEGNKLKSQHVV